MKYENFLSIILRLKKQDRMVQKLYKQSIDLTNFVEPYDTIIADLFNEIYGKEGWDWISWFCYDNNFGEKGLGAWDEDNQLVCQDIPSLWEYLEKTAKTQKDG